MVGPCAFNSLGRWTGEHIRSERGQSDIPLSALEFLGFLKTAQHITGCERYARRPGPRAYRPDVSRSLVPRPTVVRRPIRKTRTLRTR